MRALFLVGALVIPVALACGGTSGESTITEAAPSVAFTNWKIEWVGGGVVNEFDFLNDGTFVDPSHPGNNNTYSITGTTIHMEYNDSFVIYDGEFVDDFTMGGTYSTSKGKSGSWRGVRLFE